MAIKRKNAQLIEGSIVAKYSEGFAKRLREALGDMPQADLIKILAENGFEIGQGRLSHYMQGRNYPDPETVAELAKALSVSTDWLHGLTEEKLPVADLEEMIAGANGSSRIDKIMRQLDRDKRQQVLEYAEYLLGQNKQAKAAQNMAAGIEAAMNLVARKYGTDVERDLIAALLAEFPELKRLFDDLSSGDQKDVSEG